MKKLNLTELKTNFENLTDTEILNNISISGGNRKLGFIKSFSVTAGVTCEKCADCQKYCYAKKMEKLYPTVNNAWSKNLYIFQKRPDLVYKKIDSEMKTQAFFRWFVGGDIPDKAFFEMIVELSKNNQQCKSLLFTKKYDIVNEFIKNGGVIPNNLTVLFSADNNLEMVNPYKFPVVEIFKDFDKLPTNAKICGGNCTNCICRGVGCYNLCKGDKLYIELH